MTKRVHRYKDFASRIDVEEVILALGILEEREEGRNKHGEPEYVGQCPDPWSLHSNGDTTGKFALNPGRKVYNCWVCGGGSLLSLTMAMLDLDPDEATDWLIQYADENREVSDERFLDEIDSLLAQLTPSRKQDETLPYYNANILRKWEDQGRGLEDWNLGVLDGKPRNIARDALRAAHVCYAPSAIKHPPRDSKTGVPLDDLYEGPCVIFPHYVGERLVGWQHRWLEDDRPKWCSKYTNTPDFPKRTTLYKPRGGPSGPLPVVIVESVPTAIFLAGIGWPAVATFGGTVTTEQLKLLRRYQQGVILAPDNDGAGLRSCVATADYLDGFIPLSVVLPEWDTGEKWDLLDRFNENGEDIDSLLRAAERIS
ncbi:toprim domain-containing protein [Candidatus Solirubrobacter pratensis]|uniref:toprim domain-containing protein n=1 Tax=Candidatus Solirubrobacter pratensis TaxID=1298857 RepID=UPI0004156D4D|nr:toprim domain-containing protein [Candidatus Solirubrobacter pratensis]